MVLVLAFWKSKTGPRDPPIQRRKKKSQERMYFCLFTFLLSKPSVVREMISFFKIDFKNCGGKQQFIQTRLLAHGVKFTDFFFK